MELTGNPIAEQTRMQEQSVGTLDIDGDLRRLVSKVLSESGKSRAEIADEMSRLTDRRISESMLNDFCTETKTGARFPACFLPAFCRATGDHRLLDLLLPPHYLEKVRLADSVLMKQSLGRRIKALAAQMLQAEEARRG